MGYSVEDLKKAGSIAGEDALIVQQGGITKQIARSILDQAVIVTASGAQSTGIIRRENTFVLQNNSAEIRLTVQNAAGKEVNAAADTYSDSAAAAAGWIIKILNNSTRNHTIISGANSWVIAAGEIQEYYWTGSAWTKHVFPMEESLSTFITETSTILNTLDLRNKKSKMFYVSGIAGGVYNGSDFCLIASKYNDSYQMQMAFSYGANTKERKCINGTWTSWHEIVTETELDTAIEGVVKPDLLSALPTDAILHYSFDELPELPDGTANYRHNKDWTSVENWGGNCTLAVNSKILTVTAPNSSGGYVWSNITAISNSIIKIRARLSMAASNFTLYGNVNGVTNVTLVNKNVKAYEEFEIIRPVEGELRNIGFTNYPANSVLEIISIYIGNGSYSSEVIDNSNNAFDGSISNALVTKGLSNKGVTAVKYSPIKAKNFRKISNRYTYSIWARSNTTENGTFYLIDGRSSGEQAEDEMFFINATNQIEVGSAGYYKTSDAGYFVRDLKYHCYTVVKDGGFYKLYRDGVLFQTLNTDVNASINALTLLSRYVDGGSPTYNIDIDDFQLFDRTLSELEVQALYYAHGNTPKYSDVTKNDLKSCIKSVEYSLQFTETVNTGNTPGARFYQIAINLNDIVAGLNQNNVLGTLVTYIYSSADYNPLAFITNDKLYINLYCAKINMDVITNYPAVKVKIFYMK